jgi:aminoglycoside 6'-N-acetyltransferase I
MEIRLLRRGDEAVLMNVAPDVFDDPIDPTATRVFLNDPRHHIAVAVDDGVVVGFVSAVHYVHPDKARPEMWINEVAVASTHRQRGLARGMLDALFGLARELDCAEAWVLTDRSNDAAMALYASAGGKAAPGNTVMFEYDL